MSYPSEPDACTPGINASSRAIDADLREAADRTIRYLVDLEAEASSGKGKFGNGSA